MRQTKTGILLANLGTPDAPTPEAVKRYLKQFLSDRRVVDTSRLLWWPLLRGVILPLRSPRVAKLYASVWMEEELEGRRLAADGLQPPATAGAGTTFTGDARSAGHELRLAITGKRRR